MNQLIEDCTKNYSNEELHHDYHKKGETLETNVKTKVPIQKEKSPIESPQVQPSNKKKLSKLW